MDMDGTATMDAAAVALVYDILATPHPVPGQSKHDVHPLRVSAIGIHKVFEGKLAQTDLVVCVSICPPLSFFVRRAELTLSRTQRYGRVPAGEPGPSA